METIPSNSGHAYRLTPSASLQPFTTFGVFAQAACLAELQHADALPALLRQPQLHNQPLLILGGGSNILFTRDFSGVVIQMKTQGIEIFSDQGKTAHVRAAAGENWDSFVRWSLAQGLAGLENLILIPGTVGAAPMQNIGAYGVEISEFVQTVIAWDRSQQKFVYLDSAACQFAYRDSVFKRNRDRFIITAVEFKLPYERDLCLDYAGVRQELTAMGVSEPSHTQVGEAVERLRKRKLPDPRIIGNAGSFFKNPLLSKVAAAALKATYPALPVYLLPDDKAKLSAAWLIEQCNFKGVREGDAGVSEQHALVLINYNQASGAQLWSLAQTIRQAVKQRFGVTLEPEPLII